MKQLILTLAALSLVLSLALTGCAELETPAGQTAEETTTASVTQSAALPEETEQAQTTTSDTLEVELPDQIVTLGSIPDYSGQAYVAVNDNQPFYSESDYTDQAFETYSDLDELGRCGVAWANICLELMPTEKRGEIGQVKPTGWHTVKYDGVDGGYLYNRCHLIGYQLAGENANPKNLITGTRYLNIQGMLPFENLVADYVKETENHVLYRVTPIFQGDDLVASGVLMEGWSVEDGGEGICFCVYAYNVQPGIAIDYATGDSTQAEEQQAQQTEQTQQPEEGGDTTSAQGEITYVVNISSGKFHLPTCSGVSSMSQKNRLDSTDDRESLIQQGYTPCGSCKP